MKLFLTAVVLLALGSAAYSEPTSGTQDDQSMPTIVTPELLHTNSVGATLTSNASEYASGKPVHFTFVVANHSKSKVNYEFSSGQLYDVVISDSTGKAIWRWSTNKVFGQLMAQLNLSQNASVTYDITWPQRDDEDHPVPSGTYSVLAVLMPMARPEVTGNLLSDPDNDPVNTGVPMIGPVQSGAVSAKNTTPIVYAKTTVKIDAPPQ